jgi:hypothetical protein
MDSTIALPDLEQHYYCTGALEVRCEAPQQVADD